MLLHMALAGQLCVPRAHSSISSQLAPFAISLYPNLQEHTWEPMVLVQIWAQPPLSVRHSFSSAMHTWLLRPPSSGRHPFDGHPLRQHLPDPQKVHAPEILSQASQHSTPAFATPLSPVADASRRIKNSPCHIDRQTDFCKKKKHGSGPDRTYQRVVCLRTVEQLLCYSSHA